MTLRESGSLPRRLTAVRTQEGGQAGAWHAQAVRHHAQSCLIRLGSQSICLFESIISSLVLPVREEEGTTQAEAGGQAAAPPRETSQLTTLHSS